MPTYNVHLYREMRLFFPGIEADTPQQAAKLVADKPINEATTIEDRDGESIAALVDLVGDENFSESVTIDLNQGEGTAPSPKVTLLTIKEWFLTGEIDGVKFCQDSIIDEIDTVLSYASEAA